MKRVFYAMMITALAACMMSGSALADNIVSDSWTDNETGNTTYVDTNFTTGVITEKEVDSGGNVVHYEEYALEEAYDSGSSSSSSGTTKNADGSITVVSKDQTDVTVIDNSSSGSSSSGSDSQSSGGLTQDEWEARMAKAQAANGTTTETVYRDVNGNIWPVQVEYVGLGRSSIVLNGERCMVPTSCLSWVSEAPDDKLLAVVTTEKQSYVTMRAKKSQKAFVMAHCEKCQVLRVISTGKTWTMVDDGTMRGYVLTSGLTFYDNSPREYVTGLVTFRGKTTSKNTVHIRSGTTSSAKQLQAFACGTPLTVFAQDEKWTEVDVGGWHGYIMNEYVTLDEGVALSARETESEP